MADKPQPTKPSTDGRSVKSCPKPPPTKQSSSGRNVTDGVDR